jgi:large subunit ribosomal protein L10
VLRNEKVQIITELHDIFANAGLVVVTHQNGLTVGEATELRRRMRESNATYRVVKNRLTLRAIGDTPYESLSDLFQGQTAIAYSDDPVAAAKVAVAYAKSNDKLEILGGAMGELVLDVDGVKALASLPSLDELRGKIVAMLNTPATRIATVLSAPAGQLARLLSARAAQEEAA